MPRTTVCPFRKRSVISIISALLVLAIAAPAQLRNRIVQNIGDTEPAIVSSQHPLARAAFDQGRVEGKGPDGIIPGHERPVECNEVVSEAVRDAAG